MLPILEWITWSVTAFFVALLPERVREHPRLEPFDSRPIHILSGLVEIGLALLFWTLGLSWYQEWFMARVYGAGTLGRGELMMMGAVGYVTYLTSPVSLICAYCFCEGVARSLLPPILDRRPGIAPFWLIDRAVRLIRGDLHRAQLRKALGPDRPDVIVPAYKSRSGLLEIHSVQEKPWHDRQALEYRGEFYIMKERELAPQGQHHAYQYRFRKMDQGEIIRGSVVGYLGSLEADLHTSEQ